MTLAVPLDKRAEVSEDSYNETLRLLSEGSVHKHFDPYLDIDWDSPEFAVVANDRRWILPVESDPLGAHPWYQAQPEARQIEIGMWRQANIAKVGLQFENILIRGLMQYVFSLPNDSVEARYCTHESVEECNHTMMFQEMVNRIGVDAPGMSRPMKMLAPFVPLVAGPFPELFFVGVLAGEEPIDHIQKSVLRGGGRIHPIMESVMAIHVAEEARHISFAHKLLSRRIPLMSRPNRFVLSLLFPIVMRILCDAIVVPPKSFWKQFDIPKSVKKDLFWDLSESRQTLRNYFGDVRMLATDAGLMNRGSRLVWKACKMDGRASRFRSEPDRSAHNAAA
ncbi:AurF N-oxygenase family protein [Rhodococcus globerulus]|uniref:AurF N-oxygenase family protein n=1 Tax=Rhodococcus globerulus TaxID=33008 RepID=UPI000526F2C0|nr:diiron oxygenase [Rhodococcus globerulus]PVX59761.1 para-aminobenzoate N-oxygenase AurF [Rhodococcus globerulus]